MRRSTLSRDRERSSQKRRRRARRTRLAQRRPPGPTRETHAIRIAASSLAIKTPASRESPRDSSGERVRPLCAAATQRQQRLARRSDRAKGLQSARSQSRSPHTMQRGSTLWTVTRFPQAVQANWPFAKVPAGQNSTYSSSPAIADETFSCDSSTSSPFTSGPWTASRSILLVGRHRRSVNSLLHLHFRWEGAVFTLPVSAPAISAARKPCRNCTTATSLPYRQ